MAMSKGEELVAKLLTQSGYYYETEKTFEDLRGGKYRYDFYIPARNILIEVDGEQHYFQSAFGRSRSEWLKACQHDREKNSYALANNIVLYRIPFWDFNKLITSADLFKRDYIVKSKWHLDDLRRINNFDKR